jgi:RNA polymerase sigma-70 factor (ECF subfamily)
MAPRSERDDVVQEALRRAWIKRDQYDPARGTVPAWLLAITADQARKVMRRNRPLHPFIDTRSPSIPDRPDDRLDVHRAVQSLPRRQRLAVDCYYFVGLSIAETAAVMGCAEGTVKSTLADARGRLRALLEVSP